jgi:hypothetical protein
MQAEDRVEPKVEYSVVTPSMVELWRGVNATNAYHAATHYSRLQEKGLLILKIETDPKTGWPQLTHEGSVNYEGRGFARSEWEYGERPHGVFSPEFKSPYK